MIHLYCRVSTDRQENGREAQVSRLQEWAAAHNLSVDALHVDEDVSAFSTPLFDRPHGKAMWDALSRGDTILMTKVDRGFRSWSDAANTHQKLRDLGVALRFADLDIDLSTPQGELFFSQIVAFAQFESRMHGQRKREVYAHKRKLGQPYNAICPFGWKRVKDKAGKLVGYEPDRREQDLGLRVLGMRREGKSWWTIASDVCLAGDRKSFGRGSGYYHASDLYSLACAAAERYPIVPRGFWKSPDTAQKLLAMRADGFRLWPEGFDPSQIDPGPTPNLRPDRRSPSPASQDPPSPATNPQPLAG